MFLRLMLWKHGEDKPWVTHGYLIVAFGDRPASGILGTMLTIDSNLGKNIDKKAAEAVVDHIYDDDGMSGGTQEEVDRMVGSLEVQQDGALRYSGTVPQVLATVGLRPKMMITNGETNQKALTLMGNTVVGIK